VFDPAQLLQTLQELPPCRHYWVAYSGGLDSHVLLHALATLRPHFSAQLNAVHIHHGLNPLADQWAQHCQQVCADLEIPCTVRAVNIPRNTGASLEALARDARYAALESILGTGEICFTAHHGDDQAETVLLQLFRGAGVAGLSAMPSSAPLGKGWQVRPLLNYSRAQLQAYAQTQQLHWIEDDSNIDLRFDRNFLRHAVLPILRQRWRSLSPTLQRVAQHQAEADGLLQEIGMLDLTHCFGESTQQLQLAILQNLSPARQRNVLRLWIKQQALTLPSTAQLARLQEDVLHAAPDRQPVLRWEGGEIRRYREQLYVIPALPPVPTHHLSWRFPEVLALPLGSLRAIPTLGRGLRLKEGTLLTVQFRQGGEQLKVRGQHHSLKKLLQITPLPTWLRAYLPLIYWEQQLIAVPNVAIEDDCLSKTGEQAWILEWNYAGKSI
jgi:tRNA(Ile)-lysidine synthase